MNGQDEGDGSRITLPSLSDEDVLTPKICAACDGAGRNHLQCAWCDSGYQSLEQQKAWGAFRRKMRRISATYDFLDATVAHTLDQLRDLDSATDAWTRGAVLLDAWRQADGSDAERSRLAAELQTWMREALSRLRQR